MAGNIQKYEYGNVDIEEIEAEAAELARQSGNQSFLQMKEPGKYFLRFLPPTKGAKKPWEVTHQHYVKLPGMERTASFNCPRLITQGARYCPACDLWDQLARSGNAVDAKKASEYKPKVRAYANVVNTKAPEDGVKIFAFGTMVLDKLVKLLQDDRDAGQSFFCDPYNGRSIIVEKTGSGMDTKYDVRPTHQSGPLGDEDWLDQMHPLAQQCAEPSHEQLSKATGVPVEELEERDPAPANAPKLGRGPAPKAAPGRAPSPPPAAAGAGVRRPVAGAATRKPPTKTVEDAAFEDEDEEA